MGGADLGGNLKDERAQCGVQLWSRSWILKTLAMLPFQCSTNQESPTSVYKIVGGGTGEIMRFENVEKCRIITEHDRKQSVCGPNRPKNANLKFIQMPGSAWMVQKGQNRPKLVLK